MGSFWGSKTTPFGDQNRPKIFPRPVLRRLCFKNVVFQNMSPALGESTILTLLGSQDGTKIGPRSPQDRLKIVLKRDRFLRRFLIDFWSSWAPFWVPFWHPRWVQKSIKRGRCVIHPPSWRVNTPQDRPKTAKRPPKTPQDDQKWPKSAPRRPKTTQNDPKRPSRRSKMSPNDPQDDQK